MSDDGDIQGRSARPPRGLSIPTRRVVGIGDDRGGGVPGACRRRPATGVVQCIVGATAYAGGRPARCQLAPEVAQAVRVGHGRRARRGQEPGAGDARARLGVAWRRFDPHVMRITPANSRPRLPPPLFSATTGVQHDVVARHAGLRPADRGDRQPRHRARRLHPRRPRARIYHRVVRVEQRRGWRRGPRFAACSAPVVPRGRTGCWKVDDQAVQVIVVRAWPSAWACGLARWPNHRGRRGSARQVSATWRH